MAHERKFVASYGCTDEWEVLTDTGFKDIAFVHKTIEYEVYHLVLSDGRTLQCADTHILITADGSEVYAQDAYGHFVRTQDGIAQVIGTHQTGVFETMYDVTVAGTESRFYTNGILSHNTATNAAYLCWYVLANKTKTAAVLAHKASGAREVLDRVKLMYEALPLWLQQGVVTWNKGSIKLGNGCKIIAAATTSGGIRGESVACVTGDSMVTFCDDADNVYHTTIMKANSSMPYLGPGYSNAFGDRSISQIGKKHNYVFKTTNISNGEVFVGAHGTDDLDDGYLGSGGALKSAINNFGVNSFQKEIISFTETLDHARELAKLIIEENYRNIDNLTICGKIGKAQILTANGSKDFDGFICNGVREVVQLGEDFSNLRCTLDHRIKIDGEWVEAQDINNAVIGEEVVFDAVNVSDGNEYLTNGVTSHNCLMLDEFAFIPDNIAHEFFASVYPTISSGKDSKISIFSTPAGMNHYYKLWQEATLGILQSDGTLQPSDFKSISIRWFDVPGRDETFRQKTIADIGIDRWNQEFDCVAGDSVVTVKCTVTGEIINMTVRDLFEMESVSSPSKYRILTADGFKSYKEVKNLGMQKCLTLTTSRNHRITCTHDHELHTGEQWKAASSFSIGDSIACEDGIDFVESITEAGGIEVFDVLDVEDVHSFYANGVLCHNCHFLGSVGTLIASSALRNMHAAQPIERLSTKYLKVYEEPREDRVYFATVDISHGTGGDYSVINVTDITEIPYRQVAVYRSNDTPYLLMPGIIYEIAKRFNDAYVLIELNDNGMTVATDLQMEYNYDNLVTTGEKSKKITMGSWINSKPGVRTTTSTKKIGCAGLKLMVESGRYIIRDKDTIHEASSFIAKGRSYEADSGANDDIMMTLVIFAWAAEQPYFIDICDLSFKAKFVADSQDRIFQDLVPAGFNTDYTDDIDHDDMRILYG
jgi:hypothetical protein